MRERIKDKGRLEHILQSIDVLLNSKDRYNFTQLKNDPILFFGFVKHVEIIGEAVYMLSTEFKEKHDEVEWNVIERMRHVLVHGYYTIKPEQLWETIEYDLAPLRPLIQKFYDSER